MRDAAGARGGFCTDSQPSACEPAPQVPASARDCGYNDAVAGVRIRGLLKEIDDEWKRSVDTALIDKGLTRKDLARMARVSPSAITKLLRPIRGNPAGPRQSRFALAVARVTGVPLPGQVPAEIEEMIDSIRSLYEQDRMRFMIARDALRGIAAGLSRVPETMTLHDREYPQAASSSKKEAAVLTEPSPRRRSR